MKFILILAVAMVALARADDFYDSKYDDFNIAEVVENDRLLKAYVNCFVKGEKCTAEGHEFRKWIPEATHSSCGKCTDKQKVLVSTAIKAVQSKLPEDWNTLRQMHDPEGKYQDDLKNFLAKY